MKRAQSFLFLGSLLVLLLLACSVPGAAADGPTDLPVPAGAGMAESVPASYGALYNATLSEVGEQDEYVITADAGDTIFIRLVMANWDGPVIVVYRPDGTFLDWAKSNEGGFPLIQGAQLTVTLPESGTYRVVVSDYWHEASDIQYSLYMQRTNHPGTDVPLGVYDGIAASLNRVEFDTYTINAVADTDVLIDVQSDTGGSWMIWLWGPDGSLVTTATARYYWGWDSSVRLQSTIPRTGRYTVLVGSYYGDTAAPYSVFASYTPPLAPAVLAVPGGISVPGDTDSDELYDDVNGNNRPDFADVVLYFNQMTWIADHEPNGLFDYNGNGRIDFADVVWLFNHL